MGSILKGYRLFSAMVTMTTDLTAVFPASGASGLMFSFL